MMVYAVCIICLTFLSVIVVTFSSSLHVSVSRISHIFLWRNHGADLLHLLPLALFSYVVLNQAQDLTNPLMSLLFETSVFLLVLFSSAIFLANVGMKKLKQLRYQTMQVPRLLEKDKDRITTLSDYIRNTTQESQYSIWLHE